MIENQRLAEESDSHWPETVTPFDAAGYIHQLAGEMAGLAGSSGLSKLEAALELVRELAADAMAGAATANS